MASHPYISGAGNVEQMIGHLRKNFPATVTSETVKKFGLAPNNESYVVNALQFIGAIDDESKRTEKGHDIFVLGDAEFKTKFAELIKEAYSDLFSLRGDEAWSLSRQELISYFRTTDKTSEIVGGRQAGLFLTFASLAGYAGSETKTAITTVKPASKNKASTTKASQQKKDGSATAKSAGTADRKNDADRDIALTVRIEINLPANGTQETYDAIFKSIRTNLY